MRARFITIRQAKNYWISIFRFELNSKYCVYFYNGHNSSGHILFIWLLTYHLCPPLQSTQHCKMGVKRIFSGFSSFEKYSSPPQNDTHTNARTTKKKWFETILEISAFSDRSSIGGFLMEAEFNFCRNSNFSLKTMPLKCKVHGQ